MNRLKLKILVITTIAISIFGGISVNTLAATPTVTSPATVANSINWPVPTELDTVPKMISALSNLLFPLVATILFAMIVYGGITKLTAAGDAEKEKQAMQILKNAVIGTVIIVLARVIVDTISALLGAPGI